MSKYKSEINSYSLTTGARWSGNTYTGIEEIANFEYINTSLQVDTNGTLFYDFSTDGGNWSTFPVAGFQVSSGIHEYHAAHKGSWRWFRPRFVGSGSPTYFRMLVTLTDIPVTLNAPLNQSISDDSDAMTVRAVMAGADSNGNYVNVKTTSDGALSTSSDSSLINFAYDAYDVTSTSSTTDRFDYFVGGLAGTRVAYITITYEDSSKINAISAERTNI